MFNLSHLRSLFQFTCFGLLTIVALGSNNVGVETSQFDEIGDTFGTPVLAETITVPTAPSTPIIQSSTSVHTLVKAAAPTSNFISIGGKIISVYNTASPADDAGNRVANYTKSTHTFLYGHNTANVFGHLINLPVGTTFSVNLGGETVTYQIATKAIYHHTWDNRGRELLYPDGYENSNYMTAIANSKFLTTQYDLSIMTCHGTPLGGGDATERLVVFANRV